MQLRIARKDRDPLDATNLLVQQGCWQAVDAILRGLVEDLHDLFRKQDALLLENQQGFFGHFHSHANIEAARFEQVFLGQVGEADIVGGHGGTHWGVIECFRGGVKSSGFF